MSAMILHRARTLPPTAVRGVAVTAWSAAAALAALLEVGLPLQPLVVFPFVLLAPGLAGTALLRTGDRLTRLVLSVAMSLVTATIAAQVLLALGRWSPSVWITTLAALATALAWIPSPPSRPDPAPQPPEVQQ